jgi:transcriptional regulator with XRE-family HTH domain
LTFKVEHGSIPTEGGGNVNNRIKEVRTKLKITQQEFADRIGCSRSGLANYEVGRNEPINSVIVAICREFNVNEEWLRTGKGEMFAPVNRDKEIEAFMDTVMKSESADFRRRLVSVLSKLDSAEWKLLESMALKLAAEAETVKLAPKRHVVKFAGRDGSYEERILTDDEYEKLKEELDAYPKAPDDL